MKIKPNGDVRPPPPTAGQGPAQLDVGRWIGTTQGLRTVASALVHTVTAAARKFMTDRCFAHAASLSYASLVALVPMSVLAFTFFTAFERYGELRLRAEETIFQYMVPSVGEQIIGVLDQVTANIARLSLPGLLMFLFASTLLLNSLENSFNHIWGVRRSRSYVAKLVISWSLLTLVPVLLGAGWVVADQFGVQDRLHSSMRGSLRFLFTWAAFVVLVHILPYTRTRAVASLTGGLLGASLWLGSRSLFVIYVMQVSSVREALGGALATVALFLLWVYFSWVVVLLSAELAYAIQYPPKREPDGPADEGDDGHRAFYRVLALAEIARWFAVGRAETIDTEAIAGAIGQPVGAAAARVDELIAAGLVYRTDAGGLVPTRPPERIDLADVLLRGGDGLPAAPADLGGDDGDGDAAHRLARLFERTTQRTVDDLRAHPLSELIAGEPAGRD